MKTRLNKKRVAIVAVITVVIVVGILTYQALAKKEEPEYRTAKVERGMIISSVSASGRITATSGVSVTTQATGVVKNIYVKDGDYVKAGDKLFEIELDRDGELTKAKAWASYLGAKNELDSAKQSRLVSKRDLTSANIELASAQQSKQSLQRDVNLARASFTTAQESYNNAIEDTATSEFELKQKESALQAAKDALVLAEEKYNSSDMAIERAELGVSIAKQKAGSESSAIARAEANVEAARLAYEATLPVVKAPVSGTIGDITLATGMTLTSNAGSSNGSSASGSESTGASTGGKKLATIVSGKHTTAEFNISEVDVVKVKPGQKATLALDALPGKTFTGKVIGIDRTGTVSSGVTTYLASIQFDSGADDIHPNMAASASIITETKDDIPLIPSSASRTQGNQTLVTILKNGEPQQIPVTLGLYSDSQVEVVSGLSDGDEIVIETLSGSQGRSNAGSPSPFGGGGVFPGGGMRPGGGAIVVR